MGSKPEQVMVECDTDFYRFFKKNQDRECVINFPRRYNKKKRAHVTDYKKMLKSSVSKILKIFKKFKDGPVSARRVLRLLKIYVYPPTLLAVERVGNLNRN